MTIMGKILVILNLAAALLVGGFLFYDYATRSNWKAAADQNAREVTVAHSSTNGAREEARAMKAERDALVNERNKLKEKIVNLEKDHKKEIDDQKDELTKLKNQADESTAILIAQRAETGRLSAEIKIHQKSVAARDATILALEGKNKSLLSRAVTAEQGRDSLKQRNTYLVSQLEIVQKRVVKLEAGGGGAEAVVVKNSNARNPPAAYVRGRVTKILRERGLVEISLGSDQGVNTGNTMEVYRLKPRPEYLGTIKILDAEFTKSVGRILKPGAGVRHSPIVTGDEVASKILTR